MLLRTQHTSNRIKTKFVHIYAVKAYRDEEQWGSKLLDKAIPCQTQDYIPENSISCQNQGF